MTQVLTNVLLTSVLLSTVLWISRTNPVLGGFIISLPLSTLIVLAFSKIQGQDTGDTFLLAKSIFIAVPSTLTFFIPFLLAERLKLSFWLSYGLGIGLLALSFGLHRWIMVSWGK